MMVEAETGYDISLCVSLDNPPSEPGQYSVIKLVFLCKYGFV